MPIWYANIKHCNLSKYINYSVRFQIPAKYWPWSSTFKIWNTYKNETNEWTYPDDPPDKLAKEIEIAQFRSEQTRSLKYQIRYFDKKKSARTINRFDIAFVRISQLEHIFHLERTNLPHSRCVQRIFVFKVAYSLIEKATVQHAGSSHQGNSNCASLIFWDSAHKLDICEYDVIWNYF